MGDPVWKFLTPKRPFKHTRRRFNLWSEVRRSNKSKRCTIENTGEMIVYKSNREALGEKESWYK